MMAANKQTDAKRKKVCDMKTEFQTFNHEGMRKIQKEIHVSWIPKREHYINVNDQIRAENNTASVIKQL